MNKEEKTTETAPRVAVFAGSFDPYTIGHDDIARRALKLFDRLVIVVAVNPEKHYMFSAEERLAAIRALYKKEPRVSVVANDGMTVDIAAKVGAQFQVRGVRSTIDFEYERIEADYNRNLGNLETVLLYAQPQFSSISSTAYRQLIYFHKDAEAQKLLPIVNT
jgi:pantetheine-phosphate adenylyltransferase